MLNYFLVTQQQYLDLLVNLISSAEGHDPTATNKGDGQRTIGHGYTFGRNNNLALWQAAGIALTPAEILILQSIDAASSLARKNAIVDQQFRTRAISQDEARALLRQTYPQYEGPANQLGMPLSSERAAFVSLTYNRGVGNLGGRMPGFFAAVRAQDRAEAWFQMRYNAWGTNAAVEAGLRGRCLVEAQVFGLYDNVSNISPEEAKQVFRMWTRHQAQIRLDESRWGVNPDGTSGTRNLIAEVNTDMRWATLPRVIAVAEAFSPAAGVLVSQFGQGIIINWQNIQVGEDTPTLYYRGTDTDYLAGTNTNDLILGDSGNDVLEGKAGQDVIYGGTGLDIYRYRQNDGNDIIRVKSIMTYSRTLFGLLMLLSTNIALADTSARFVRVACWPEIGLVEIEAVSAGNVDSYDAKSLKNKHSVYTGSFETTCQGVRVKVERHPMSATGMCAADPSADIYVWLDGKPILSQELFGNSCGSSYIQKVQVNLGAELVVCLAGWWQKADAKKNSTTPLYTGYSIGDRMECRGIGLRNVEYPLNLRRLFHDSTLQP